MRAGPLRHRIGIQQFATATDDAGQELETWADWLSPKANIRWGAGDERVAAAQKQAAQGATFIVRSTSQSRLVTVKHRIIFDGRTWEIKAIADPKPSERHITAIARIDV